MPELEIEVLFLSDPWLAAVDDCLATTDGDADIAPEQVGAVVRYIVDDAPDGASGYDLEVGADRLRARRSMGDATVTLTMAWDLAVAINQGTESAQRAVLDGRIAIGGDPQVLVDHADAIAATSQHLADLRAATVYA